MGLRTADVSSSVQPSSLVRPSSSVVVRMCAVDKGGGTVSVIQIR